MSESVRDCGPVQAGPCAMAASTPSTYFAPAGRATADEVQRQKDAVAEVPLLKEALDAMPTMVMVLNGHRQIVGANESLLTVLNTTVGEVAQRRPGEAVGCIRAKEGPDGCGTSRHCVTCGAVNAILECQKNAEKVVRECRILVDTPQGVASMDLRVTVSPFRVAGAPFLVASVEDVSQAKRLSVLQRTFFHDVLNTAGCIQGYSQFLHDDASADQEVSGRLLLLSQQLIESIQSQRDLIHAESGDLRTQPVPLRAFQILEDVRSQYAKHPVAEGRTIELKDVWEGMVITDRLLIGRVLGNMVKNALEATAPGGIVSMSCTDSGGEVTFAVHNPEVMPEGVQLQVFQRSFSTKGEAGRGIGTYSMKLLGERYLGGKVDFSSRVPEGTSFTLTIPKKPATVK